VVTPAFTYPEKPSTAVKGADQADLDRLAATGAVIEMSTGTR